jgi:hypothetical protein
MVRTKAEMLANVKSRAEQVVDARGRFTTTISAEDPANLPGRHTIRCTDGTSTATTPYQVTG